jgi:putative PIN family toxin of toxin-antitoxin system
VRVVLDTGILVAALITRDTPPDQLYQLWRKRRFTLITSESQLDEFRRVTRYRKLRQFLKAHEAGTLLRGVRARAVVVSELPEIDLVDDPDDNIVLATALAGAAGGGLGQRDRPVHGDGLGLHLAGDRVLHRHRLGDGAPRDELAQRVVRALAAVLLADMKKEADKAGADELREEYDFSRGVRGKYAQRYSEGTTIIILDADVAKVFRDSESVNKALRALVEVANKTAAGS